MNFPATGLTRAADLATAVGAPFAVSLSVLLLATGCVSSTRRQIPPASTGILGPSALSDPGLKRFMEQQLHRSLAPWPLLKWDFPKLTLVACYFNPRLVAARNQWQHAQAALAAARGKPAPQPNAPSFPPETQALAWQVRAGVRTNLIDYVAAQHAETLLQNLETNYVKLVELAESGSTGGSSPPLDLSLLRLQLAQTRLVLIRSKLAKMAARTHLAESLALPADVLFGVEVDFDLTRQAVPGLAGSDLRWQALHNRSDVLNLLADYTDAEEALRAETGNKAPPAQPASGCRWDQRKGRWVINPECGLPTRVHWGRTALRAEARRLAAATRLLNLQAEVLDEVDRSATVHRVAVGEAVGIEVLVAALVRQYTAVQRRFESGIAGVPELTLARVQLLAAGLSKLETQVNLQHTLGSLEDTLQLPAESISPVGPL